MSTDQNKVKVVLCWHMHQPEYRDGDDGVYRLPWTYLHGIKDYIDMANIIAAHPKSRAVVNFAPVLLEQIDDYTKQITAFLSNKTPLNDPLLAALAAPQLDSNSESRRVILDACVRANQERLIDRFPPYKKLIELSSAVTRVDGDMSYLSDQYLFDLLVWYHLAWTGETVRRESKLVKRLSEKARQFTHEDRLDLLRLIGEMMSRVIPSYKELAKRGQIELAFSPFAHPIVPLLLDLKSAREAMPDVDLPRASAYPGGNERAHWHVQKGLDTFEKYFGFKPRGCWPSEGSVSEASLNLFGQFGIEWVATGESVLRNSLGQTPRLHAEIRDKCIHRMYRLHDKNPNCFFRDDGLSDLIGFTYARWHADDAIANLVHHIDNIAVACNNQRDTVISIILDGENAWEYYPENGFYFLNALYQKLSENERFQLTTFSDCIDQGIAPISLERLVAGSWVYGTFSTWIGDKDKNRGWDLLCEAKRQFDLAVSQKRLAGKKLDAAIRQLATCEGSDWFWWFGDYNPAAAVSDFEQLFRSHLRALYRIMGVDPPKELTQIISKGGGDPDAGGVMRPGQDRVH